MYRMIYLQIKVWLAVAAVSSGTLATADEGKSVSMGQEGVCVEFTYSNQGVELVKSSSPHM